MGNFFRCETPSTTQEVLCYASLIGTAYGLVPLIASGGLAPALAFSQANPQVVPMIMAFSVMGYSSVSFILSLVISFALFPKELNWKYIAGFAAVVVSTVYTFYLKQQKNAAKAAAKFRPSFSPRRSAFFFEGTIEIYRP